MFYFLRNVIFLYDIGTSFFSFLHVPDSVTLVTDPA